MMSRRPFFNLVSVNLTDGGVIAVSVVASAPAPTHDMTRRRRIIEASCFESRRSPDPAACRRSLTLAALIRNDCPLSLRLGPLFDQTPAGHESPIVGKGLAHPIGLHAAHDHQRVDRLG